MQAISPCLWFDGQAEEAAEFYVSLFENSSITGVSRYGEGAPFPEGTALTVTFSLNGSPFQALNGGPHFTFSEAVSFSIPAEGQEQVDHFWDSLIADGGEPSMCGWLKDRFGVSWQVVPTELGELLGDPDPERAGRAMAAMLKMTKIDIAELRAAADGA